MAVRKKSRTTTKGRFKLGDWVAFPYGAGPVVAQVVEGRGPLGGDGTHIYRVRVDREYMDPYGFEMPEDLMEPVPLPDKAAVMKYLKEGGLVDILRTNLGDGKKPPKVWLSHTAEHGLTFTTRPERGVLGGALVPYFALFETRVFKGKKEAVLDFLEHFGLNGAEAEEVVAVVGTWP
jgi:hypothetical protein